MQIKYRVDCAVYLVACDNKNTKRPTTNAFFNIVDARDRRVELLRKYLVVEISDAMLVAPKTSTNRPYLKIVRRMKNIKDIILRLEILTARVSAAQPDRDLC